MFSIKKKFSPSLVFFNSRVGNLGVWSINHIFCLGESLLHILIICDTLVHTRIARLLLQNYPRLAVDKIEGEEYLGEKEPQF